MGTLSPTMTVREFENGYWYVDELRDFGGRIGGHPLGMYSRTPIGPQKPTAK